MRSLSWMRSLLLTVVFLSGGMHGSKAQEKPRSGSLFGRKYLPGESYRYRLTTDESENGHWRSTTIVICRLTVAKDSAGVEWDEIRWLSKKMITGKDTVGDSLAAASVRPYRISLDPRGRIDLPAIIPPAMTGAIEDFNTFFVAVSPELRVTELTKKGDSVMLGNVIQADFSNGRNILKGDDCFKVGARMTSETANEVVIYTSFLPPEKTCFSYITQDMNIPVIKDTQNNFQMIQPTDSNKFNVQYGREFFYIVSVIRKPDGKIVNAEMINDLSLKLKLNCDRNYMDCKPEFPYSMERRLTLELLP
jgi:hypothetical protein